MLSCIYEEERCMTRKDGMTESAIKTEQDICNRNNGFPARDENGFTSEEAAELKHRIEDVRNDELVHHDLLEE